MRRTPRPFCLQNAAFTLTVSGLSYVTKPPSPPTHCAATARLSTCSLVPFLGSWLYSKDPSSVAVPRFLWPGPVTWRKLRPKSGIPSSIFLPGTPEAIMYCTLEAPDGSSLFVV